MAPEQAAGKVKEIGPLADVYALGAILYELLTGRPPFKGATPVETLAQVLDGEPVPPRRLQPRIARDLETICLKCLRKEAPKRYASAEELAADLERFLDGQPVRARPVPGWERGIKWAQRRPAQAALAATVVLLAFSGLLGSLAYGLYKDQQAKVVERQLTSRRTIDELQKQGQDAEAAQRMAEAERLWDRALATLAAEPEAAGPEVRGQLEEHRDRVRRILEEENARERQREQERARLKDLQSRMERFQARRESVLDHEVSFTDVDQEANRAVVREEATAALKALDLTATTSPADVSQRLAEYGRLLPAPTAFQRLAEDCYQVLLAWAEAEAGSAQAERHGKKAAVDAMRLLDQAAALAEANHLPPSTAYYLRRSRYLAQCGDEAAARAAREEAARRVPRTALDHFLLALDRYRLGEYSAARTSCEEAGHQEPGHFWAQYLQAVCCLRLGRWVEAKDLSMACLSRRPHMAWAWNSRAVACMYLHEVATAQSSFTRALEEVQEASARAVVLTNRSALWVQLKRWDGAVIDLKEAIRLQPNNYQGYATLAQAYRQRQRWNALLFSTATAGFLGSPRGQGPFLAASLIPASTSDWNNALGAFQKSLVLQPRDATLYYSRAILNLDRKDLAAARSDFQSAIQMNPRTQKPPWLPTAYVELAHLQHQAREYNAALESCDAALRVQPTFPSAYLQRATTLLAVGRNADAGRTLDRFLSRDGTNADIYVGRALIHTNLREYPEAIEAYTLALRLRRDAATLASRGWLYLKMESAQPALFDFKAALRLKEGDPHALCGKGQALVLLGQMPAGLECVESAMRKQPRDKQVLFNAACTYAKAVEQLAKSPRDRDSSAADQATRWQDRAVAILARLLDLERDRAAFWRDYIQYERNLLSIQNSPGMLRLSEAVARPGNIPQ
jgi:tetratricopeptide (TPR) repeat protein